jgi:hypothetical protein
VAGLVSRAEEWRWGNLYNLQHGGRTVRLSKWLLPRRTGWLERVNEALSEKEERQLQRAIERSQPFGSEGWVELTARKHNLEMTLRPRGRAKKLS